MGVESYLHRYAKIVMASWLRKKIRIGTSFKGLNNIPIDGFNVTELKTQKPMLGVYTEYPVCYDKKAKQYIGLQCTDAKYCTGWEEWLDKNGYKVASKTKIPTAKEIEGWEHVNINYIFDVVIVDKGQLKVVVEIQHKHPVDNTKAKFLQTHIPRSYEVSAQIVMEQVKLPYKIECLNEWCIEK